MIHIKIFIFLLGLAAPLLAQAQPAPERPAAEVELLKQQIERLREDNQRLNQGLAQLRKTAANAFAIDARNQQLETQMVELERELQLVRQENRALSDRNNQAWFLRGAGVLLAGFLLGLFIPSLYGRKTSRWSEL